jgi:hypothetical protein
MKVVGPDDLWTLPNSDILWSTTTQVLLNDATD